LRRPSCIEMAFFIQKIDISIAHSNAGNPASAIAISSAGYS